MNAQLHAGFDGGMTMPHEKRFPVLSVIMPVYNAEAYLKEAVASLLNQTFTDFELILINDASTDSSRRLAEHFAQTDHRIRLLDNEGLKGIVGALNTGLKHSRGRLIARADGDDIYPQDRFQLQVDCLCRHPAIMITGGGYAPFKPDGTARTILYPASPVEIGWRFVSATSFCHPSVMFRREVFETCGGYPSVAAEDYVFFSRIVRDHPCTNIRRVLVNYRETQTGLSAINAARIAASVRARFEDNFRFYGCNEEDADLFFNYQRCRLLKGPGEIIRVHRANRRIISRICKAYRFSLLDRRVVSWWVRILIGHCFRRSPWQWTGWKSIFRSSKG
jgi:glycosyltransferase involved in cell wall biosynthesis